MKCHDYVVTQDDIGTRLDRFLAEKENELSRSFVQKLISDGRVTICGAPAKPSYNVREGDLVKVRWEPVSDTIPRAEDIPLNIIFEDDDVIVVDKPAGMVVHPAAGIESGTLVNAILAHIQTLLQKKSDQKINGVPTSVGNSQVKRQQELSLNDISPERPGIVHRIDKGTSGLVLVAKTARAYYNLADQFKEHSVRRVYVTLVCGGPSQDSGTIVAPIGRSRRDRKKMAVTPVNSREAITHFSVIERYHGFSLLEIKPRTGRTHQIRVHLAHIGYPVVGDPTYGGRDRMLKASTSQALKKALQGLSRQALHAQLLGFIHPRSGEYMEFSSPIPGDMQNVIDALRSYEE